MGYYNYRFPLLDNFHIQDLDTTIETINKLLFNAQSLKLHRVEINLTGQNKSISLLSELDNVSNIQCTVEKLLSNTGIIFSGNIEVDNLTYKKKIDKQKKTHHKNKDHHSHEPHQGCCHNHNEDHDSHGKHQNEHWLPAILGLASGLCLLLLSIASFNIPIILSVIITGFSTLLTVYLGRTVYLSAWRAMLEKRLDTSTLYTISTLTIVIVSIMSMFVPGLPMIFEAAPLVLGFWHLGEAIEHSLLGKINDKLDVLDCVPPLILLKNTLGEAKEVSVKQLIPNDVIVVTKGNVIPVDGTLINNALLYTSRIDGSPKLKEFKAGSAVKAGMRLADHMQNVEMSVTKTYKNSYLSLIAKNMKKANGEKAPIEIFANKILKYFIPSLLAIALVSGCVIGALFTPALAIQCVISVLVSACPCALSLITPLAIKIGIKKGSENGLHFKNGKILQAAADIDIVVFDLNGTLTQGSIDVDALNISDKKFLSHVALLEAESDHPIGKLINSYIKKQNIIPHEPLTLTSVDKSYHCGIKGMINNETFIIGNSEMLLSHGISLFAKPYNNPKNGSIYIVRGKTVIGQIALFDPLREDASITIKQLERLGKKVHICTGSDMASAEQYAQLLGVPVQNICANAVGVTTKADEFSKASYIKQLKNKGYKVAMVGDAINDITAISCSDIGIAVKSDIGDDITQKHADIVVQKGLLFPIATAFDVAKKTKQNIVQNLFISLTYNTSITLLAAGLFVFLGFTINPIVGVSLMICESTLVLMNLFRFKQQEIVSNTLLTSNEAEESIQQSTTAKVLEGLKASSQPQKESSRVPWHSVPEYGSLFSSNVLKSQCTSEDQMLNKDAISI